jgi:NADP-dependent 3-hydroxy acid dehydrogenase YdfG
MRPSRSGDQVPATPSAGPGEAETIGRGGGRLGDRLGKAAAGAPRAGFALLLTLSMAQVMVVLDFTIVNVALPSIQHGLHVATTTLQWLISGYAVAFGGFLLLGGRLADVYGRARLFRIGLVVFVVASIAGGLAVEPGLLKQRREAAWHYYRRCRGFIGWCLRCCRVEGRYEQGSGFRVRSVLQGTVALVTGASSGIGAATASALAAQGASVAVAARRRDRLEAVAGAIRDQGGTALVLECDVTDKEEATGAVERTVSELGRLDTLINNAGVMLLGPVVGAPVREWQRMVDLNVLGLLYCAHAALPHLLRAAEDAPRQVADMVNISSVAGRAARNGNGVYSLTKHGVGAFSESLRQEVTKRYVRVSLVEPGATATELASHNRPQVLEAMRSQFGQRMEAEDIADAITYIVTRPRHVAVNEMLIRPTEQER